MESELEMVKLVYQRFRILHMLYPNKERNITGLAKETGMHHGNVSKYIGELEKAKLITTREEKRDRGKPYKYCKLTHRCKGIIQAFIDAAQPEPGKLKEPIPKTVGFLISMIENPTSGEALDQARSDFREMCRTTTIWKYRSSGKEDIWAFFKKALDNRAYYSDMISCLSIVTGNAVRTNNESVTARIRKEFTDRILDIASSSDNDMGARRAAVGALEMIMPVEKRWEAFTGILEKSMAEEKNYTYGGFVQCLFSPFKELHHNESIKSREWFYKLMSNKDQTVRLRALEFYQTVLSET